MSRLDKERQQELEPKRIEFAKKEIEKIGLKVTYQDNTKLIFDFKGNNIQFYPYSGWYTGKGVIAGRGIKNLIKQLC